MVNVLSYSLTDRQIVRNLARPGYPVQYSSIDKDLESVSAAALLYVSCNNCYLFIDIPADEATRLM